MLNGQISKFETIVNGEKLSRVYKKSALNETVIWKFAGKRLPELEAVKAEKNFLTLGIHSFFNTVKNPQEKPEEKPEEKPTEKDKK